MTVSRGEQRVLDLQVDDFEVLDARVREQVVTFARGDIPFTAIVLRVLERGLEVRSRGGYFDF